MKGYWFIGAFVGIMYASVLLWFWWKNRTEEY